MNRQSRHLVCASCNGVVADGRCAACRAARAELDAAPVWTTWSPQTLLLLVAGAVALVLSLLGGRALALT